MRSLMLLTSVGLLCGCAANLTFIDRSDGGIYAGTTSATISGNGTVTAVIENEEYSGNWIYVASGGNFTIGNAFVSNGQSSASMSNSSLGLSAVGNGLVNMKGPSGKLVRCVFNFNSLSNKGMGECIRSDGKQYDLYVKR